MKIELVLAAVVGILVLYWFLTRYESETAVMDDMEDESGTYAPTRDSARAHYALKNDWQLTDFDDEWRLPVDGRGSMSFRAHKPGGGLIVGFTPEMRGEGDGYAIVIDNGHPDQRKSYVARIPMFATEMPGSKQNLGFKFPDHPQDFWVSVDDGFVAAGIGREIGKNVIVYGMAVAPVKDGPVRYLSFGTVGQGTVPGEISQIRIHEYYMPQPQNH